MSGYIDADALMETIRAHEYPLRSYFNSTDNGMFTIGIQQAVDEQPTVDAVSVVRCRECKHCFVDGDNVRFNVCELTHNKGQSDDWFCADGERKDGEHE